jgi:hypothetical protein
MIRRKRLGLHDIIAGPFEVPRGQEGTAAPEGREVESTQQVQ